MHRRKLLQSIAGVSTLTVGAVPAAGDEKGPSLQTIVQTASKLRARRGEAAKHKFVDRQPVEVKTNRHRLPVTLGEEPASDGGMSIQEIPRGRIMIDMEMWYHYKQGIYAATMDISYDLEIQKHNNSTGVGCTYDRISYGEDPLDAAALTWNTDRWTAISPDRFEATTVSGDVERYDPFETGMGGHEVGKAAFRVDDDKVSENWQEIDYLDCPGVGESETYRDDVYAGNCGVYLQTDGDYSSDERFVKGGYTHAWSENSPRMGVSLSVSGDASITFNDSSGEIKEDPVIRDENGDEIMIKQSEQEYRSGGV